jgi:hypothetical protein
MVGVGNPECGLSLGVFEPAGLHECTTKVACRVKDIQKKVLTDCVFVCTILLVH